MIKLRFDKFQEELKKARRTKRPTVHYLETEDEFKILFKNYEFWEYYTIIDKAMIIEHGMKNDLDPNESVDDFRMEYLYQAVQMEEETIQEILDAEIIGKVAKQQKDPYADSPMEKAMLTQIEESRDKLEFALNTLL